MKSLNVKKIAALAAGTALVGAAFAAAGAITYSNTPIISESGVPQVKVVVGEGAAASDGVVAANIAAMVGNLAWRTQAVTATVAGTDGVDCTVSGASGGQGTCAISNEKVWLNVTLPGTVSGAVEFRTLINDYVDRKLENRNQSSADDKYNQTNDISPLDMTGYATKKFTANDFPALQVPSITDTYANVGYTEEQTLWVRATTEYDSTLKKVVAVAPDMAYKIEFTHDQYGIPFATCNPTSGNILVGTDRFDNNTKCTLTDRTDRHRVTIKFLGEDYIISYMDPPDANASDSLTSQTGGSIKLAKESAYGIIHVGENLSTGSYYVKLADITTPTTTGFITYASIEIYDMNDNLLKEDKIQEGQSYGWTAPDGSKIRIRNYQNNPGYYAYAKWAEMAIYSKEFELIDGQKISDECEDWIVSLTWKNKDPSKDCKYVDSLKSIILKNEGKNPNVKMVEGDTQSIICSPAVWQLQYNGLSCADPGDYDSVGFTIPQPSAFTVSEGAGVSSCTRTTRLTDPNVLRITSGLNNPFTLNGNINTDVSDFYVNMGTNLLNLTYGTNLSVGNQSCLKVAVGPGDTEWSTSVTFSAVGVDPSGEFVYGTGTANSGSSTEVTITSLNGRTFQYVLFLTATGAQYNQSFSLQNCSGSNITYQDNLHIGMYNDVGEIIFTLPGESTCSMRMLPTSINYDVGEGVQQPFGFGAGVFAAGTSAQKVLTWSAPGTYGSVGAAIDLDNNLFNNQRAIGFRENSGNSQYDAVAFYLEQRNTTGSNFQFVDPLSGGVMDTTPDKMNYTGTGTGPRSYDGEQAVGFITERGSKFASIGTTSASMKMAKKVCEGVYYMKTTGTSPNEPVTVGPLGEGESTTGLAGGIVIKVNEITEDVGTCTAEAGAATCTVTGLDALTATPSVTSTVIPTDLDTSANKLVVLDKNADKTATLIVVGGNTVNTIADEIVQSSNIDLMTDTVVVRAIGTNRILVAGYTAQDTMTAGDQFIQALIAAKTA